MIAAIYARKSPVAVKVDEDAKSVTRQTEHARAYAARKGWTVDNDWVIDDDNISGAEFDTRKGLLRLLAALKPHPPFQALVMSEESRLGRETIETAFVLKQFVQAGVRVFFYLTDTERTLNTPIEKATWASSEPGSRRSSERFAIWPAPSLWGAARVVARRPPDRREAPR